MFRHILNRLAATVLGLNCDRCECRGTSLTIDAERASRTEHDGGRVVHSTYAVRGASALCLVRRQR